MMSDSMSVGTLTGHESINKYDLILIKSGKAWD